MTVPISPDTELSSCCRAPMIVVGDSFGEGTNHYECTKCGNSCNRAVIEPQNMQEKLASSISPTENTEELRAKVYDILNDNLFTRTDEGQPYIDGQEEVYEEVAKLIDQTVQAFGEKVLKEVKQDFVHEESSVAFDEGRMYEQFRIGRVITSLLKGGVK